MLHATICYIRHGGRREQRREKGLKSDFSGREIDWPFVPRVDEHEDSLKSLDAGPSHIRSYQFVP